jgi:putative membrane protein
MFDWILRFLKGMLIGSGFILPGVSGAALAIIFGLYQRIVSFLANIQRDFIKNVWFLTPVAIGGLFGIFLLSRILSFLLENFEVYLIWGFIGCIVGILPSLWKDAGREGRTQKHIITLVVTFAVSFISLVYVNQLLETQLKMTWVTWLFSGSLLAFSSLIPGLSSSNLLIALNIYDPFLTAIKTVDVSVLTPIVLGALICVYPLTKGIDFLFRKYRTATYHSIVGFVISSTLIIVPLNFDYLSRSVFGLLGVFVIGVFLGLLMSRIEDRRR